MKCLLYAPSESLAQSRTKELQAEGHEVIASVRTHDRLKDLMAEFEAFVVVIGSVGGNNQCRAGCATNIFQLITDEGHDAITPPPVWEAALALCKPARSREQLITTARAAFLHYTMSIPLGLACLPDAWLAGIPPILARLAEHVPDGKLPLPVFSLGAQLGVVEVSYAQDSYLGPSRPGATTWWAQLRRELNLSLYPTLWRPLTRNHWQRLHAERPELRRFLESAPWGAEDDFE
jgi:hypothetical protein